MRAVTARVLASVAAGVVLLSAPAWTAAADWSQWMGRDRNGIVAEPSGAPGGWPPVRLWERNVGKGCTSAVFAGGRMYVMGWQGRGSTGTDTLYCLEAATGKELWRQSYRCRYQGRLRTGDTGAYGGPSSTPTLDPQTRWLYTLSTDGDLRCWDTSAGGKPVWAVNLHAKYPMRQRPDAGKGRRDYGHTSAPLVHGEQLIVEVNSTAGTVMGFDKRTGRGLWASQFREPGGHSSGPVPLTVGGHDCVATLALFKTVVLRVDPGHEGQTVATFPWQTDFANNIPTPATAPDRVVVTSNYNISRTGVYAISQGKARQLWTSRYHSKVCSPVLHKGRIYTVEKSLKCLDLATGRLLWRGGSYGHGSCLITSDDKVIVWGNGKLALVEALPQSPAYTEISRLEGICRGTCYPHVALADGLICCKDRDGRTVVLSVRPGDRKAAVIAHKANPPNASVPRPAPRPAAPPRPRSETDKLHDAPVPKLTATWPGNLDGAVFCWQTAKAPNRHAIAAGKPALVCRVAPRGAAKFDAAGRMDVANGAMLAEGADERLLTACRQSHQLAVEARIAPASGRQTGPARIVSFSTDGYHRNFTLAQEGDKLLFRLRTPRTGVNGMNPETTLCTIRPGRDHHVIVSYSPGRLCCYLDGRRVLDADRVTGDFSTW